MTAAVSPKFFNGLGSLEIVWRCWRRIYGSQVSRLIRRSGCIVLMYGSEVWSLVNHYNSCSANWHLWFVVFAQNPLDSIYQTCYQRYHQADDSVVQCWLLSSFTSYSREMAPLLWACGTCARADFKQDHHWVIEASLRPPSHWRRPCGRPRSTWPVTIHSGDASPTWQHSINGTPLKRGGCGVLWHLLGEMSTYISLASSFEAC